MTHIPLRRILAFVVTLLFLNESVAVEYKKDQVVLEWDGAHLTVGNSLITRRWTLVDGLPAATSVLSNGVEWIQSAEKPTTSLPRGFKLTPPFDIKWRQASGRAGPTEAVSAHGVLTVLGADGLGYLLHVKVFPGGSGVTMRLQTVGGERAHETSTPTAADPASIRRFESPRPAAGMIKPDGLDMLEDLTFKAVHLGLIVVDLVDATDRHDTLASERNWRLSPKEAIEETTILCAVENPLTGEGLVLLKHAPLPHAQPLPAPNNLVAGYNRLAFFGHGVGPEGQGYSWSVIGYANGRWGRAAALHELQNNLREFDPSRDGKILSNTWGDRNRDARVNETFVRQEMSAGHAIGIDVCQIDDGWQKGITSNSVVKGGIWHSGYWSTDPEFWKPRGTTFPNGMAPLAAEAARANMELGLWFSPDGEGEYRNWARDAEVVTGFYRDWNVKKVKIDGMVIDSKTGEANFHRFVDTVLKNTEGKLALDLDVTDGLRPGYFGLMEALLFVENRYSDWHQWWPTGTLRNMWQLSWYVAPQRLRIEFLNPLRNQDKYAGDPLAPANYPPDSILATTLVGNPLAWFEVSNLDPKTAESFARLIAIWKNHRAELQSGTILPIGDCPTGGVWTGFCSVGDSVAHVLVFREAAVADNAEMRLPITPGAWRVERIAGSGGGHYDANGLHVSIPESFGFAWLRLTKSSEVR